ncbi:MAG: class I lanthipeptide [Nitrososphaeraceae archaeon]
MSRGKIKNNIMNKLSLNKETIAVLNNSAMSEIKGGFTYSLSAGELCTKSKALGYKKRSHCKEFLEGKDEIEEPMEIEPWMYDLNP